MKIVRLPKFSLNHLGGSWFIPLCCLCLLGVSVVSASQPSFTTTGKQPHHRRNPMAGQLRSSPIFIDFAAPPGLPVRTAEWVDKYGTGSGSDLMMLRWNSWPKLYQVATTTPRGLPALGPRSAPGSVFIDPLSLITPPTLPRQTLMFVTSTQDPGLDYSNFKHTSQRHASLACSACHIRTGDNSATPQFPGHRACISCHSSQFYTSGTPMCAICHSDLNGTNPPRKAFPTSFKESFNLKFDHLQHNAGAGRPASGCASCHARLGGRATALSIPSGISAHNQCYSCHRPDSKSAAGRDLASCGVCHDARGYSRTSTNARAFRYAFSHAKHGNPQRLGCPDCHRLAAGLPQSRQVSSPAAAEHFPAASGMSCLTCHNGKRSFGGDLAFKDCRRCHTSASFKMPL